VLDTIKRLGDSNGRCSVYYHIHAFQSFCALLPITDVSDKQLGFWSEIGGIALGVHLGVQIIEHAHLVALRQEAIHEERPDESGAACYEHSHQSLKAPNLKYEPESFHFTGLQQSADLEHSAILA
jgi:hypothetical protein